VADGGEGVRRSLARGVGAAILAATLLVSALLTLVPERASGPPDEFLCFTCSTVAAADSLRNVALFVPLGIGVSLLGGGIARAALVGAGLSGAIEAAQKFLPGRDSSARDVATNTLGAMLGALAWRVVRARAALGRRTLDLACAGSAVGFLGLLLLAAWLFAPSLPSDAVWYGGYTMQVGDLAHSQGRLDGAWLGDLPVARGRLLDSAAVRQRLADGAPARVRMLPGPRVEGLAPWFSLVDGRQREIALLGANGDALVWRVRTRGRALTFVLNDVRADGFLTGTFGDAPLDLRVEREGNALCFERPGLRRCGLGTPAGRGWALLLSTVPLGETERAALDALWLLVLAVPCGFFLRASPVGFGAAALLGAGLGLAPPLAGLLPARLVEALAAAGGLSLGFLAARLAGPARAR
jgi:hypothetical protein